MTRETRMAHFPAHDVHHLKSRFSRERGELSRRLEWTDDFPQVSQEANALSIPALAGLHPCLGSVRFQGECELRLSRRPTRSECTLVRGRAAWRFVAGEGGDAQRFLARGVLSRIPS